MFRNRLTVLIACLTMAGLLLAACSDDDTDNTGKKDTGAVTPDMGVDSGSPDKTVTPDTSVTPDQTVTPDKTVTPDMPPVPTGVKCTKDSECYPTVPICDPTYKVCVECTKDTDCKDSSGGAKCVGGDCSCTASTDCAGTKTYGAKCLKTTTGNVCGCTASTDCAKSEKGPTCPSSSGGYCGCSANTDCKTGTITVCSKSSPSTASTSKVCTQACKADTECAKELSRQKCDTTGGGCVACLTATDCSAYTSAPWNSTCTTSMFCVECMKDADCTAKSLGNKCDTTNRWCTCKATADCASNENGKVCHSGTGACSCTKDSDCPTGKKCTGTSPYLPSLKFCK